MSDSFVVVDDKIVVNCQIYEKVRLNINKHEDRQPDIWESINRCMHTCRTTEKKANSCVIFMI